MKMLVLRSYSLGMSMSQIKLNISLFDLAGLVFHMFSVWLKLNWFESLVQAELVLLIYSSWLWISIKHIDQWAMIHAIQVQGLKKSLGKSMLYVSRVMWCWLLKQDPYFV